MKAFYIICEILSILAFSFIIGFSDMAKPVLLTLLCGATFCCGFFLFAFMQRTKGIEMTLIHQKLKYLAISILVSCYACVAECFLGYDTSSFLLIITFFAIISIGGIINILASKTKKSL